MDLWPTHKNLCQKAIFSLKNIYGRKKMYDLPIKVTSIFEIGGFEDFGACHFSRGFIFSHFFKNCTRISFRSKLSSNAKKSHYCSYNISKINKTKQMKPLTRKPMGCLLHNALFKVIQFDYPIFQHSREFS